MQKSGRPRRKDGTAVIDFLNREYDPKCPIESLIPHPDNPRESDCGAIQQSIVHNGFYGAIVAQKSTGYILAGNHRYRTLLQQGVSTIPVIWIECSAAAAKRILISDNRSTDLAHYDENALANILDQIKIDETGLGWMGTGWDDESYETLLSDLKGIDPSNEPESDDSESAENAHETCPNCGYTLP